MTDRELLENAAKAAGIDVVRSRLHDPLQRDLLIANSVRNPEQKNCGWNPLTDDGDALRLAVKLRFEIDIDYIGTAVRTPKGQKVIVTDEPDATAATRRAIVRAAAEIGKSMP